MRGRAVAAAGAAALLAACGSPSSPTAETVTQTNTVTVGQSTSAPSGPQPESDSASWTMPDLIGRNLQDAQDEIQRVTDNGIFYTGSTDLTGQGRNQILDRNWQVCTSTPPPGSTITTSTNIDFGVVRIDSESCP